MRWSPAIADAVRGEHATLVVMRHIRKAGWRRMIDASLIDEHLELLDNVNLHIVEERLAIVAAGSCPGGEIPEAV
jgi:hypothetical protein